MNKIKTVAIGIPAHNEERNIANLLKSVLSQTGDNFKLLEVLIISDGSTDRTNEIVKNFEDKRIKLIIDKKRLGKSSRLNQIFRNFKGQILILHDADVLLENKYVYKKIINGFIKNPETKLVIGNPQALPSTSFIGKAIHNFFSARENFLNEFNYRRTVFGARAGVFALSKDFAKSLKLKKDLLNDDAFIYLLAKYKGYKIHFQENAVIWYRSAQTASDYRKQAIRFIRGGNQLTEMFKKDYIEKETYTPKKVLIKIMLYQLFRNPIGYFFLKLNTLYCRRFIQITGSQDSQLWSPVESSKNLNMSEAKLKRSRSENA